MQSDEKELFQITKAMFPDQVPKYKAFFTPIGGYKTHALDATTHFAKVVQFLEQRLKDQFAPRPPLFVVPRRR